jgi:hypothetical protein
MATMGGLSATLQAAFIHLSVVEHLKQFVSANGLRHVSRESTLDRIGQKCIIE